MPSILLDAMKVGVDAIEISRIRRALERYPSFRERCFTEAERAYCDSRKNPAQSYAGRFAGKEAVGKALGLGVARAFAWRDIEIVGRPKPSVTLTAGRARGPRASPAGAIDLSMTHNRELAVAVAVVEEGLMLAPLYTSDEMKAAEAGHDVSTLMERAGRAVAEEAHAPISARAAIRAVRRQGRERRRREDRRAHPRGAGLETGRRRAPTS